MYSSKKFFTNRGTGQKSPEEKREIFWDKVEEIYLDKKRVPFSSEDQIKNRRIMKLLKFGLSRKQAEECLHPPRQRKTAS